MFVCLFVFILDRFGSVWIGLDRVESGWAHVPIGMNGWAWLFNISTTVDYVELAGDDESGMKLI